MASKTSRLLIGCVLLALDFIIVTSENTTSINSATTGSMTTSASSRSTTSASGSTAVMSTVGQSTSTDASSSTTTMGMGPTMSNVSSSTSIPMSTTTDLDGSGMSGSGINDSNSMLAPLVPLTTTAVSGETVSPISTPPTTPTSSPTQPTDIPEPVNTVYLGVAVGVGGAVLVCLLVVAVFMCWCYIKIRKQKKVTPDGQFLGQSHNDLLAYPMDELSNRSDSDEADGQMVVGSSMANYSESNIYAHLKGKKLEGVPLQRLAGYVVALHENERFLAEQEYKEIKNLDPPSSTRSASQQYNEIRNRYINILANEATRVVLSAVAKRAGSDYINANYIDGYSEKVEYIAAQGPLPNTVVDFWRMVWEKDARIIVMVTNLVENAVEKSHEYWPSRGTIQYGQVVVTLESQKLFPEFVKRTFAVSFATKNSKANIVPQTIVQYHFTVWPDFGVPQHASGMLKFVRRVRRAIEPNRGPVVIHCSAGVGRTGTFIGIDVMLQKMEAGEPLNVMEFVCKMRAQRNNMVQTSPQYLFIYDALLHSYLYGNTEVDKAKLKDHVSALSEPFSEERADTTRLDKEFELVMFEQFVVEDQSVALMDFNSDKNRSASNIPFDDNRVVLENMESPAGHDYINASFINGYYNRPEFIATQHPLPDTVASYWRMITEREVFTIITIGPVEEEDNMFWPVEGTKDYGGTTVEVISTEVLEEYGITVREMEVECAETERSQTVKQFHLNGYPSDEAPASAEGMLQLVLRSREHWRASGFTLIAINTSPSVVNEAAGIYCALCILLRQLEVEESVDLITTVQQLRRQRPAILTSKENFRFIYEVLESAQRVCTQ